MKMLPVLPDAEDMVDTSVEPIAFLAAIRQIASSEAVSGEIIKGILASIHVKQNKTNTDDANISSRKDKAVTLLKGLTEAARTSEGFETMMLLFTWDFGPCSKAKAKKRQYTNGGNPDEVKRRRIPVNSELNGNNHGDNTDIVVTDITNDGNENNQPSTSGVAAKNSHDHVSTIQVHQNQAQSVNSKDRQKRGSTSSKIIPSYANSPIKGMTIPCHFCDSKSFTSIVSIDTHYRTTHKVMDPEQILFYDGTPLFSRPSSNIKTQGGKATWFQAQLKEAKDKYAGLKFNCRLCDIDMSVKEMLDQHYINTGNNGGHLVDKSRVEIMNRLFKFRTGANLEGLPTSNPRKVRKTRSAVTGNDRSESPESNDNVSTQEMSQRAENPIRVSRGRIDEDRQQAMDRPLGNTQIDTRPSTYINHRPISIGSDGIVKIESTDYLSDDDPNTSNDDYNGACTYGREELLDVVTVSSPRQVDHF